MIRVYLVEGYRSVVYTEGMPLVIPSRAGRVARDMGREQEQRRLREAAQDIGTFTDFTARTIGVGKSAHFDTWLKEREKIMDQYRAEKRRLRYQWHRREEQLDKQLKDRRDDLERHYRVDKLKRAKDSRLNRAEQMVEEKFKSFSKRKTRRFSRERSRSFRMLESKRNEQMRGISQSLRKQYRASSLMNP